MYPAKYNLFMSRFFLVLHPQGICRPIHVIDRGLPRTQQRNDKEILRHQRALCAELEVWRPLAKYNRLLTQQLNVQASAGQMCKLTNVRSRGRGRRRCPILLEAYRAPRIYLTKAPHGVRTFSVIRSKHQAQTTLEARSTQGARSTASIQAVPTRVN